MRTLKLRDEELQCIEGGVSMDLLFELAEVAETANGLQALRVLSKTLYSLVVPEDHPRLKAVLGQMTLADIEEINTAVGGLLAAESARPTGRPSVSPAGSEPTGQPLRVVSFSRATDAEASPSRKGGRSRVS